MVEVLNDIGWTQVAFFATLVAGIPATVLSIRVGLNLNLTGDVVEIWRLRQERIVAKSQTKCNHNLVYSDLEHPYCDRCGKEFDEIEEARNRHKECPHQYETFYGTNEYAEIYRCDTCGKKSFR